MTLVDDFYNKSLKEIDERYFPEVGFYQEDKRTLKIHQAVELFSNGMITYTKLLKKVSKFIDKEKADEVFKKYIVKF